MRTLDKEKQKKNSNQICQCSGCGKKTTAIYQDDLCRECLAAKFQDIRNFIDETRSRIFSNGNINSVR
ncbi:MAG: hypothetical protein H3C43_05690 [Leptonema sp. (in: Bacteria)]|nr:hypothetical protein [Leptonema sp. (in: bacteria)]